MINSLNHYSMQNIPTIFDEEALTALELAARTASKVNECVEVVNRVASGLPGDIAEGIKEYFKAHPEAYFDLEKLAISPEMFGAKGDGQTDDTPAILAMIEYCRGVLPVREFDNEASCIDWTSVALDFNGKYLVTAPVQFSNTYGLKLDGLCLIAGEGFEGKGVLCFDSVTRNLGVTNMTVNANFNANVCVHLEQYSLTTDFTNVELCQFKKYGFYAVSKGHEIKMANVKINQVEWGRSAGIKDMFVEGTGLYLGEERHDNNFTNVVINYCHTKTVDVRGGTNVFVNCHFYGGYVNNIGTYNVFQNCYFDGGHIKTMGFFTICNCFFNKHDVGPFIYLLEEAANDWRYTTAQLNENTFKANSGEITTPIDLGAHAELPSMNTIGNVFYYVTPFVCRSPKSNMPTPWTPPAIRYGTAEEGYMDFQDYKLIWGTYTHVGDGTWVIFPNGIKLSEVFYIGMTRMNSAGEYNYQPFPADIRADRFWPNLVGAGNTIKWFVVGR